MLSLFLVLRSASQLDEDRHKVERCHDSAELMLLWLSADVT
jgi:hypothetical protein